jgi:uncharacterized protein YjbJ (UPF0337 family)
MELRPNKNMIKGRWTEMKGDLQKYWGKLTNDELEETKGEIKAISGLIQQKYGKTQANFEKKLAEIYKRFDNEI